ncbi:hypothetical protein [Rhodococcus koreensis]
MHEPEVRDVEESFNLPSGEGGDIDTGAVDLLKSFDAPVPHRDTSQIRLTALNLVGLSARGPCSRSDDSGLVVSLRDSARCGSPH